MSSYTITSDTVARIDIPSEFSLVFGNAEIKMYLDESDVDLDAEIIVTAKPHEYLLDALLKEYFNISTAELEEFLQQHYPEKLI